MIGTSLSYFWKEDSPSWISYGPVKVFGCISNSSVRVFLYAKKDIQFETKGSKKGTSPS